MPNPLSISITGGTPTPNDAGATMSRSGTVSPNQATWTSTDRTYNVVLPSAVWSPPAGGRLSFSVGVGSPSGTYTLLATAALGDATYGISSTGGMEEKSLGGVIVPKIIVKA